MGDREVNCRIHMNGNCAQDFVEGGKALLAASRDARKAVLDNMQTLFHGRNYQHLEPGEANEARDKDGEKLAEILQAITLMSDLGLHLALLGHKEKEKL